MFDPGGWGYGPGRGAGIAHPHDRGILSGVFDPGGWGYGPGRGARIAHPHDRGIAIEGSDTLKPSVHGAESVAHKLRLARAEESGDDHFAESLPDDVAPAKPIRP